jgi:hypothetical protein
LVVEAFLGDSCIMRNPGAVAPSVVVASISYAGGGLLNWMWISGSHIKLWQRVGEVWLPVKTGLRLRSRQAMAAYEHRYLVEGIAVVVGVFSLVLLRGKP